MNALLAQFAAESGNTQSASRRMLQAAESTMTREQVQALLDTANAEASKADAAAKEAADKKKAAADAAAKAEEAKQEAYTTKPVIEGVKSMEDQIKEAYGDYQDAFNKVQESPDDFDLQRNMNYYWTIYNKIVEAKKKAEDKFVEENPAAAAAAEAAKKRKAAALEKAQALPNEEKLALLKELDVAMAKDEADANSNAVDTLMKREGAAFDKAKAAQKDTVKNKKATQEEKDLAGAVANKADKRYTALKQQLALVEDKKQ